MARNSTLTYRVGQLEKQVDKLDRKMDKLMTNHIPHLNEEVLAVKTRVNVLFAVNMGAILVGVLIGRFL